MRNGIPSVLEARDLHALLRERPEIRLLDVRTPAEYEAVHVRGAYNVPLGSLEEHGAELRAHVSDPIVLVCQSGQRARRAEAALKESGMPNLHVLGGGMEEWLGAGLPVKRGGTRLTLERQVRVVAGPLAALGAALALLATPWFALLPLGVGSGLVFAGVTGRCGLALVLTRLPYNRPATCDVAAMVAALRSGSPAAGAREGGAGVWDAEGGALPGRCS